MQRLWQFQQASSQRYDLQIAHYAGAILAAKNRRSNFRKAGAGGAPAGALWGGRQHVGCVESEICGDQKKDYGRISRRNISADYNKRRTPEGVRPESFGKEPQFTETLRNLFPAPLG